LLTRQACSGHQKELSDSNHYLTGTEATKEGQAFIDDLVCVSVCYFIYSSMPSSQARIIISEIKRKILTLLWQTFSNTGAIDLGSYEF